MTTTTNQSNQYRSGGFSDFKQYLGFEKKFGYLHDIHVIPGSKTRAVRISVPQGQGNNITYETFELYVKPADALVAFLEHEKAINDDETKVTVRFSCGNIKPRAYVCQSGEREGEILSYFHGNLNHLFTMKVDGKIVHGERNDQEDTLSDEEKKPENIKEKNKQSKSSKAA